MRKEWQQEFQHLKGYTNRGTIMTYGYNPYLASWSPFHGAVYAAVESVYQICSNRWRL